MSRVKGVAKKVRQGKVGVQPPARSLATMDDETFAKEFETHGPTKVAQKLGIAVRNVFMRRNNAERRLGRPLQAPDTSTKSDEQLMSALELPKQELSVKNGMIMVGGDAHYWPGSKPSTAHRGFLYLAKEFRKRLAAVVMNGDVLDAPTVSRHPPIGWEKNPELYEELAVCQERLGEIQQAAGRKVEFLWPLGNHDARFNTKLAVQAPEFRNVPGTRLVDHFPEWEPCWAVFVNGKEGAVIKHRFKGGVNAPHNNTMWAGRTMVTGHLHSAKVTPFTDYNGTRWGVDAGTLSCPTGPQYAYSEQNPSNHLSGFCVLTFEKGELLWPELCTVHSEARGLINWRGQLIKV